jgi:hypothetical protein
MKRIFIMFIIGLLLVACNNTPSDLDQENAYDAIIRYGILRMPSSDINEFYCTREDQHYFNSTELNEFKKILQTAIYRSCDNFDTTAIYEAVIIDFTDGSDRIMLAYKFSDETLYFLQGSDCYIISGVDDARDILASKFNKPKYNRFYRTGINEENFIYHDRYFADYSLEDITQYDGFVNTEPTVIEDKETVRHLAEKEVNYGEPVSAVFYDCISGNWMVILVDYEGIPKSATVEPGIAVIIDSNGMTLEIISGYYY